MAGNVLGDQRTAEPAGLEGGLLVQGADHDALFVVQHRQVDRAGNAILGEFRRAAGIDDLVKAG